MATDSNQEPLEWFTEDGWKMAGSRWLPVDAARYRPVVIVHGLGEHSGKYDQFASYLNGMGHPVFAMDLRGHGRSEGGRGDAPSLLHLVDDLKFFMTKTGSPSSQLPLVVGHSMGGLIATLFAMRNPAQLAGLFLISPYYQAAFEPKWWRLFFGQVFYQVYPAFSLDVGLRLEHLAEDAVVRQAIVDDPLSHQKLSARWAIEALRWGRLTPVNRRPLLVPTTIVHGLNDRVTSSRASQFFAKHQNQLAVEASRELPVHYEGLDSPFHQIHNDSGTRDRVLKAFAALSQRVDSKWDQ